MSTVAAVKPKRKRFSMIRSFVLADFLTLGNGFCGSGSVLAAMQFLVDGDRRWFVLALMRRLDADRVPVVAVGR